MWLSPGGERLVVDVGCAILEHLGCKFGIWGNFYVLDMFKEVEMGGNKQKECGELETAGHYSTLRFSKRKSWGKLERSAVLSDQSATDHVTISYVVLEHVMLVILCRVTC